VTGSGGLGLVERSRAAARGDWQQAFDLLLEADADGLLAPADLPSFGEVAYAAGYLDVTIEAWERAHAACVQAGDDVAAAGAAVRVAMHLLSTPPSWHRCAAGWHERNGCSKATMRRRPTPGVRSFAAMSRC
jgi:hypothetical protein